MITGVWLRREERDAVVMIEVNDEWIEVIRERIDGPFSHIAEESGLMKLIEAELERSTR